MIDKYPKVITFIKGEKAYTIHRLSPNASVPECLQEAPFYSVTRTPEELSIICPSSLAIESDRHLGGWRCLKVMGPLDFSLTGILSGITTTLAEANISLYTVSTFDTDYIFVKENLLDQACKSLIGNGYKMLPDPSP